MQWLAMIGLVMICIPIFFVKDKRLTAHPQHFIAEICLLQAILYFYFYYGSISDICFVSSWSLATPMIEWIPIKSIKYWHNIQQPRELTLKLTLKLVYELEAFIGMIQLFFSFFFVIDMLMTWYHPIKYVSH
jgi:hypothetical protein